MREHTSCMMHRARSRLGMSVGIFFVLPKKAMRLRSILCQALTALSLIVQAGTIQVP